MIYDQAATAWLRGNDGLLDVTRLIKYTCEKKIDFYLTPCTKSVPRDFIFKHESCNTESSRAQYIIISSWSKIPYWDTKNTNHEEKKANYIKL